MAKLPFTFRPRIIDALQGYSRERLSRDLGAGLTVGMVALPLAMAFAIASGLKPEAGIFTAIVASLAISLLGGSRVQIGGPAGAFIVIVYGIVAQYGVANLLIATLMSGVLLVLMGLFRLGTLVRFIPIAVVIGFTNGIAVLIGLSQVKAFLGLDVPHMPADFIGIVQALWTHLHSFNPWAFGVAVLSLVSVVLWQRGAARLAPTVFKGQLSVVPGSIVALVLGTSVVSLLDLPVDTIGSTFGGIPSSLPSLSWPEFDWDTARHLLMPAITLAVLGAIESLLCARVADGMIDDRHDPNQELMAQGVANLAAPLLGGMPATGTIARTVTNIKSGATSPIAGLVHAATLLLVIVVAAPLAANIPLATLSAILMFVAYNMGEWHAFAQLRQFRLPYRATLLAVFLLTVIFDLTIAVEVGLFAACATFIYRISSLSRSEIVHAEGYPILSGHEQQVHAYRLYGALFFGAVKLLEAMERHLPEQTLVLDLKNLIYIDSSGADALDDLHRACLKKGVRLVLCGAAHQPSEMLGRMGLRQRLPDTDWAADLAQGLARACAPTTPH